MHPEDEVHIWERITTCFNEAKQVLRPNSFEELNEIFSVVFGILNGIGKEELNIKFLSNEKFDQAFNICKHPFPIYDFKDEELGTEPNTTSS